MVFWRAATPWVSRSVTSSTVCTGRETQDTDAADFGGHAAFAGAFGALGYWLHGVKISQQELLEKKQKELTERRLA